MRGIELSPRLQSVADFVLQGARFADVGTDHAYLPVWLLQHGRITHAVVSDLREGPLSRARQTAARFDLAEQVSFRLCNGLSQITPEEADTIAIAGMGGETIAAILTAAPWTKTGQYRLLLQPMSAQPELRTFLAQSGYTIVQEVLSREGGTLYTTFLVRPGLMPPLSPAELWAGRHNEDPLRQEYLSILQNRVLRALAGLRQSAREADGLRLSELERVQEGLEQMREECLTWQP